MRNAIAVVVLVAALAFAGTAAAQNYAATLDGLQEVPPVPTPAVGTGTFSLSATKMLSFNISYAGLIGTETAAHFHGPAPLGMNAGVQIGLPAGNPKIGTVGPLTAVQEADLNAGLWYVNIHTNLYPGGEIRGQIFTSVPTEDKTWGAIKALYDAE